MTYLLSSEISWEEIIPQAIWEARRVCRKKKEMLEFLVVDEGKNVCRVPLCEYTPLISKERTCAYQLIKYGAKRRENRCIFQSHQWSTV